MSETCPEEGCRTVQIMARQLDDAVDAVTSCLEKMDESTARMTAANNSLLITITKIEMTLIQLNEQQRGNTDQFNRINTELHNHGDRLTTIEAKTPGASTPLAAAIAASISGAIIAILEYLRR